MNENFSPVIFLYGMALVLAVGKACTLSIWRTLPKPRPPLRQEVMEAWRRRKLRARPEKKAVHEPQSPPSISKEVTAEPAELKDGRRPVAPAPDASFSDGVRR